MYHYIPISFALPIQCPMKHVSISIANNHTQLRKAFAELLENLGHKVLIQAEHGSDLLQKLKAASALPDVCVMDLHMPVMDGFLLAKEIKEQYPHMKVIAFSMSSSKDEIERVLASGADKFIYKGDYDQLQDVLLSYC